MSNPIRLRVIADEHHGDYVDIGEPQVRALGAELKRLGLLEPTPVTVRLHSVKTGETVATSDPVEAAADALVNAMIYGKSVKAQNRAEAAAKAATAGWVGRDSSRAEVDVSGWDIISVYHAGTGKPLATFSGPDKWVSFWDWHNAWIRRQGIVRSPCIYADHVKV